MRLFTQIGCVALVRAVQAGGPHCLEAMQLLHAKGALLDGQDQDGRTALHQAIRYNRLAETKWLVRVSVFISSHSCVCLCACECTALHQAIRYNRLAVTKWLVRVKCVCLCSFVLHS